jgi:2-keto-3-deoxy-L-rhamnonate aldolase RhmA
MNTMDMTGTSSPHGLRNALLDALRAGQVVGMVSLRLTRSVEIAAMVRASGFEALYIDMEHSTFSAAEASHVCIACLGAGITPLVRVPVIDEAHVSRLLDAGAMGVIAPHVHSAAQARHLVDLCRFPPLGRRSAVALLPQLGYRAMVQWEMAALLNQTTAVIAMVEDAQALANVDEMAAVEGIDVLFVGCSDLGASLGVQGAEAEAVLATAVETVIDACRRHGKVAGIGGLARQPDLLRRFVARGARLVSMGTDLSFLMDGARRQAAIVRDLGGSF